MKIRKLDFRYCNSRNDSNPSIIVLHEHNGLICGLNLNYLDDSDKEELLRVLPSFYNNVFSRDNVTLCETYIEDIFRTSYRTYKKEYMDGIQEEFLEIADE
jgi:hypothetical protein